MCDIDLEIVFAHLKDEQIVTKDKLPVYERGQDIDMLCKDIHSVARKIILAGIALEYEMKVKKRMNQIHIDFMNSDGLELRFDLYGSTEPWTRRTLWQKIKKRLPL